MERLTGRLTCCEQQGLVRQVSHVTSDVDKIDLNNRVSAKILSHPSHVITGFCSSGQLDFRGGSRRRFAAHPSSFFSSSCSSEMLLSCSDSLVLG